MHGVVSLDGNCSEFVVVAFGWSHEWCGFLKSAILAFCQMNVCYLAVNCLGELKLNIQLSMRVNLIIKMIL